MNYSLTITPHGLIMRERLPAGPAALDYIQHQACGDVTVAQLADDLQVWSLDDAAADVTNELATRIAQSYVALPQARALHGPCTFTAAHDHQGNIRGLDVSVTRQLIQLYDALSDTDHVASIHYHPAEKEGGFTSDAQLAAVKT